jgi:hypothetical protein
MKDIATDLVHFMMKNHGDDHMLLICDELDAYCCKVVLGSFVSANSLVWFVQVLVSLSGYMLL